MTALVRSMTGYGRGAGSSANQMITVEAKSVNHRYLEIVVRMPKQLLPLEERIKKLVQEKVTRGRLDLFLTLEKTGDQKNLVKVDKEIGLAYYKALKELSSLCQIGEEINLAQLAQMPGVIMIEEEKEDLEAMWPGIEEAVIQACQELVTMRTGEGEKLALDLKNRGRDILDYVRQIEERSPLVVQEYQEKLTQRVQELLGEIQIDESKLASEVAFFADRASITEELVRLKSHLSQMNLFLDSNDAVGRKLDFLVQEMNREINTIGSKGNDLAINRVVVEVKSELEKVREQVQNLE
ncbi:YicC/YloC family endoribonuclease [Dehalobacterium formicoaceticum]|uniref:YicC/YloC family endoribonuclease n=1 Tax=Dehalobacterium formicoaceticum TaxID=51515 RepID=UPI0031F67213